MSIATYTDLQTSIGNWLHRSDLSAQIPDFVSLAEARIARDLRLRGQVKKQTYVCVAGTRELALPSDYLESENMSITVSGIERPLRYITSEVSDERTPEGLGNGIPAYFSVIGTSIFLGPTPDDAYTVTLYYYGRVAALSTTPTNFLLTNNPGIYLFGALAEAAPFLADDQRAGLWETKYRAEVEALQTADDESIRSGASMRIRVL